MSCKISTDQISKDVIHTVYGYVHTHSARILPDQIVDLLLFFYAKPLIIRTISGDGTPQILRKDILFCPIIDTWDSVCQKILWQHNKRYYQIKCLKYGIYGLNTEDYDLQGSNGLKYYDFTPSNAVNVRIITSQNWDCFRWNPTEIFEVKADRNHEKDGQALTKYVYGNASLDNLFNRFDCSAQGFIDDTELGNLVFCALRFFCAERDPEMPELNREQCEPFVKKIIVDLKPQLDATGSGVISRENFALFGQYLNGEYEKLKNEMTKLSAV